MKTSSLDLKSGAANERKLELARDVLARSRWVAAFSGAGLSAGSGLPTFRDPGEDALWSRYDPIQLASVEGFAANPDRVIDWYNWRRRMYAGVAPNAAHRALAAQSRMVQITQNVDNLLEQAGAPPDKVYHLHGDILRDRCHNSACGYDEPINPSEPKHLRPCPRCGDRMRPAVVWFGENLPERIWEQAHELCMGLDCLLVIGTSATVYPAAGLIGLAAQCGSRVIVIDPGADAASGDGDIHLQGSAVELVPPLLEGFELRSYLGSTGE